MSGFWDRGKERELERQLRANRPEPPPELLGALADRVRGERPRLRVSRPRIAVAVAFTAALVAALGAVGAMDYGGAGAARAVASAEEVFTKAPPAAPVEVLPAQAVPTDPTPQGAAAAKSDKPTKSQAPASSEILAGEAPTVAGALSEVSAADVRVVAHAQHASARNQYGIKLRLCRLIIIVTPFVCARDPEGEFCELLTPLAARCAIILS